MELLVRSTPTHFSTNVSMAWYASTGQKIQHLLTYKMVEQMTGLSVHLCRANNSHPRCAIWIEAKMEGEMGGILGAFKLQY